MSAYRQPPASISLPKPAPWWRILRAWLTGSLRRYAARGLTETQIIDRQLRSLSWAMAAFNAALLLAVVTAMAMTISILLSRFMSAS